MPGVEDVVRVDARAGARQLMEHHLEPQLVGLVGDDEQELVVLLAQAMLKVEQLRDLPQVGAIRELASFLAEIHAHVVSA